MYAPKSKSRKITIPETLQYKLLINRYQSNKVAKIRNRYNQVPHLVTEEKTVGHSVTVHAQRVSHEK